MTPDHTVADLRSSAAMTRWIDSLAQARATAPERVEAARTEAPPPPARPVEARQGRVGAETLRERAAVAELTARRAGYVAVQEVVDAAGSDTDDRAERLDRARQERAERSAQGERGSVVRERREIEAEAAARAAQEGRVADAVRVPGERREAAGARAARADRPEATGAVDEREVAEAARREVIARLHEVRDQARAAAATTVNDANTLVDELAERERGRRRAAPEPAGPTPPAAAPRVSGRDAEAVRELARLIGAQAQPGRDGALEIRLDGRAMLEGGRVTHLSLDVPAAEPAPPAGRAAAPTPQDPPRGPESAPAPVERLEPRWPNGVAVTITSGALAGHLAVADDIIPEALAALAGRPAPPPAGARPSDAGSAAAVLPVGRAAPAVDVLPARSTPGGAVGATLSASPTLAAGPADGPALTRLAQAAGRQVAALGRQVDIAAVREAILAGAPIVQLAGLAAQARLDAPTMTSTPSAVAQSVVTSLQRVDAAVADLGQRADALAQGVSAVLVHSDPAGLVHLAADPAAPVAASAPALTPGSVLAPGGASAPEGAGSPAGAPPQGVPWGGLDARVTVLSVAAAGAATSEAVFASGEPLDAAPFTVAVLGPAAAAAPRPGGVTPPATGVPAAPSPPDAATPDAADVPASVATPPATSTAAVLSIPTVPPTAPAPAPAVAVLALPAGASIDDVAAAINAAPVDVGAHLEPDVEGVRLVVSAHRTGADTAVAVTDPATGAPSPVLGPVPVSTPPADTEVAVQVDGEAARVVHASTPAVSGALPGLSLTPEAAAVGRPVDVSVRADPTRLEGAIAGLAAAAAPLAPTAEASVTAGPLAADPDVIALTTRIARALAGGEPGRPDQPVPGLRVAPDRRVNLDREVLRRAVETDSAPVEKAARGVAHEVVAATRDPADSRIGALAVRIMAEQAVALDPGVVGAGVNERALARQDALEGRAVHLQSLLDKLGAEESWLDATLP